MKRVRKPKAEASDIPALAPSVIFCGGGGETGVLDAGIEVAEAEILVRMACEEKVGESGVSTAML